MTFTPRGRALAAALPAILLGLAGCTDATGGAGSTATPSETPSATASPTASSNEVDVFSIPVGACLSNAVSGSDATAELVDCETPHRAEAYSAVEIPLEEYPGDEALATDAESYCYSAFAEFVGLPLEESIHDFTFLYPTEESWTDAGDREVLCLAVSPEARTGSLGGAAE